MFFFQPFPFQVLLPLNLLKREGNERFSFILKGKTVEMDKNPSAVSLPEQKFPLKTLLIKTEVNDVWKKVGQILVQEEKPDSLALHLSLGIAEEVFRRLVRIKDLGMGIREKEGNLDRIEEVRSAFKHFYHP
jgi:hypothetical protein